MNDNQSNNFLFGNIILAIALFALLYMGQLWEALGPAAMAIWVVLVGVGVTLLMKGQDPNDGVPK